jgi:hypothetical protein
MANSLMAETNAEDRHGKLQNHPAREAEIALSIRAARAGRNNYGIKIQSPQLFPFDAVVLDDERSLPGDLPDYLVKIESERIIVVDN